MSIKIYKVSEIVDGLVTYHPQRKFRAGDLAAILTKLEPPVDPLPGQDWTLQLFVGEGVNTRVIRIALPPLLSQSDPLDTPIFIAEDEFGSSLIYFRGRLFAPERSPGNAFEREEIILRVKKATYEEETDLSSLRAAVANLEAAVEFQRSGSKRDPIPEHVKLTVWARDGGACVRCGSKQALHFDHIIPVARGGGNSEENIQILCQTCNLRKSDKIAIT